MPARQQTRRGRPGSVPAGRRRLRRSGAPAARASSSRGAGVGREQGGQALDQVKVRVDIGQASRRTAALAARAGCAGRSRRAARPRRPRTGSRPGGAGRSVPSARGSSGEPGTANTSRPCSAASRAVISEPERSSASTTTTPRDRPEMMRLRRGKSRACACAPRGFPRRCSPARRCCRRARRARADRCRRRRRPARRRCRSAARLRARRRRCRAPCPRRRHGRPGPARPPAPARSAGRPPRRCARRRWRRSARSSRVGVAPRPEQRRRRVQRGQLRRDSRLAAAASAARPAASPAASSASMRLDVRQGGVRRRRAAPGRAGRPAPRRPCRSGCISWSKATGPTRSVRASRSAGEAFGLVAPRGVTWPSWPRSGAPSPFSSRPMFSWWRIQISTAMNSARSRIGAGRAGPGPRGAAGHRAARRPRRSGPPATKSGQRRPRSARWRPAIRPSGQAAASMQAEEGRHALAALEAQPDREQVAEEGRAAGDGAPRLRCRTASARCSRAAAPLPRVAAAGWPGPDPCGRSAAHWSRRYCPSRCCARRRRPPRG